MKDGLALFLVITIVACAMYLGITRFLKKSFDSEPIGSYTNSAQITSDQQSRMEKIQRQQKDLMRQQKQRIRDMSR